ncbi:MULTISPECIES: type IV toxin-antitoxin system AbiEi family antitoxin domain-containing protein [unclassified Adlercreutzia]|uniref:type IV toxin-antitoxin system AbiEi family antitoxin domain-containing protein n=1 Tax=unclassified Adlercreutzia TaxID=2636013 RepID=UPI0013ED8FFA|nr:MULTISPECIES: type IV toxin-antitoxin system AbiEi family antitoxin domain-containing protein [unclassified Adlercreutzia]
MKVAKHTQTLDRILEEGDGIITASAAAKEGVPKDSFYRYVKEKELEKQGRGIYLSKDAFPDELALLQARFPKAIFSHDAALFLHDMSEREPIPLSVSVESGYNSPSLKDQGVRIYYVKPEWHSMGVCDVKTPDGNLVKAYDKERTICDVIRKRKSTDVTEFNYALKSYVSSKGKNLARLSEYARTMNMESRVWGVMGVLL